MSPATMRFCYLSLVLYSVLCTPTFVLAFGSLAPLAVGSTVVSYSGVKSELVLWERDNWGTITANSYLNHVFGLVLYPF